MLRDCATPAGYAHLIDDLLRFYREDVPEDAGDQQCWSEYGERMLADQPAPGRLGFNVDEVPEENKQTVLEWMRRRPLHNPCSDDGYRSRCAATCESTNHWDQKRRVEECHVGASPVCDEWIDGAGSDPFGRPFACMTADRREYGGEYYDNCEGSCRTRSRYAERVAPYESEQRAARAHTAVAAPTFLCKKMKDMVREGRGDESFEQAFLFLEHDLALWEREAHRYGYDKGREEIRRLLLELIRAKADERPELKEGTVRQWSEAWYTC